MVFFTCNKCGESVKKKDVEKHCFRCRGPPFLTCVDCLKDFREDFVKHTACVSEDARYSAKGLSGIQEKPKTKQQIWVETVHNCLSRAIDDGVPNLTKGVRELLTYLQEQVSIPDKHKTFFNYIKNSRRAEPKENIDLVWKLLEKARNELQAKLQAEREAADAARRKAKEEQIKNKKEESSESSDDSDSSDGNSDKKQKINGTLKNKAESQTNATKKENAKKDKKKKRMVSESESVINGSSESRKSKKKKKNPEDEEESEAAGSTSNLNNAMNACHLTMEAVVEDEKISKKERKEKKKREKYEAEMKQIEEAQINDDAGNAEEAEQEETVDETEGKKSRKKKNKKSKNAEEETGTTEEPVGGKERKKDKKNKKKGKQDEETEKMDIDGSDKQQKNGKSENGRLNETLDMEQVPSSKFSWDATILQVLEPQEEMSLKKLSKKVIGEYLMSVGEDAYVDMDKISSKFHKRLEKMHNVLIYKDKVKLKTSRN